MIRAALKNSQRTVAALAARRRQLLQSREEMQVASATLAATLAAILRLDPTTTLFATDGQPVPIAMVSESDTLDDLMGQGIAARPEVMRQEALLAESFTRTDQEHWRPWLPHVYAGFSGGGFGGNSSSRKKEGLGFGTDQSSVLHCTSNFNFENGVVKRLQTTPFLLMRSIQR